MGRDAWTSLYGLHYIDIQVQCRVLSNFGSGEVDARFVGVQGVLIVSVLCNFVK